MIVDKISNWELYPLGEAWEKAFKFLKELKPDAVEKYYWLEEKEIYARVMSYETIGPDIAKIEAHHKYIDIQSPLTFAEGIGWYPVDDLETVEEYNEEKDVYFLKSSGLDLCKIDLYPGTFAFFSPKDAHKPKLIVGSQPETIKKVVVKINVDLISF